MSETPSEPAAPAAEPGAPPPLHRGWSFRTRAILWSILLAPVLIFSLYTFTALKWSYSDGYRAGVLQKFSRKGWLCKTWEGELAMSTVPGVAPVIWEFSVRNGDVARKVSGAIGQRVALHYTEHRGVPTNCFGNTNYFVDSVDVREPGN